MIEILNHTVIQGRLTADPELRYTQSNTPVCSFTVAWSEKVKDNETKLFLNCVAWRGTAETVSKYFRKGKEIIVEGKLTTRSWRDKDGNNRSAIELTVASAHFCGSKQVGNTQNSAGGFTEISENDGSLPY